MRMEDRLRRFFPRSCRASAHAVQTQKGIGIEGAAPVPRKVTRTAWLLPGQIFEETPDRSAIEMVHLTGPVCATHGLPPIQHLSSTHNGPHQLRGG